MLTSFFKMTTTSFSTPDCKFETAAASAFPIWKALTIAVAEPQSLLAAMASKPSLWQKQAIEANKKNNTKGSLKNNNKLHQTAASLIQNWPWTGLQPVEGS